VILSAPLIVRRILALGILFLPIVLIWLLAVDPLVRRYAEAQDAIERSMQVLARYRANVAQKATLEQANRQRRQDASQVQGLIEASNVALATSALQSGLRRLLEANGGSVRVLSIAPPTREQGYDRLAARAEINVGADRLINVLYAIESSVAPNLTVDAMDVRSPDLPPQGAKTDENANLVVRLDVSGFWEPR